MYIAGAEVKGQYEKDTVLLWSWQYLAMTPMNVQAPRQKVKVTMRYTIRLMPESAMFMQLLC